MSPSSKHVETTSAGSSGKWSADVTRYYQASFYEIAQCRHIWHGRSNFQTSHYHYTDHHCYSSKCAAIKAPNDLKPTVTPSNTITLKLSILSKQTPTIVPSVAHNSSHTSEQAVQSVRMLVGLIHLAPLNAPPPSGVINIHILTLEWWQQPFCSRCPPLVSDGTKT